MPAGAPPSLSFAFSNQHLAGLRPWLPQRSDVGLLNSRCCLCRLLQLLEFK